MSSMGKHLPHQEVINTPIKYIMMTRNIIIMPINIITDLDDAWTDTRTLDTWLTHSMFLELQGNFLVLSSLGENIDDFFASWGNLSS